MFICWDSLVVAVVSSVSMEVILVFSRIGLFCFGIDGSIFVVGEKVSLFRVSRYFVFFWVFRFYCSLFSSFRDILLFGEG